jgi:C4-dicarboxylate transporter DctQ subunit
VKLLHLIGRAYTGLIWAMMAAAAIYVGLIMVAIVYLTVWRSFGWEYSHYTLTFIVYGFIYILFLGSPWLIRNRGHVYIELLTAAVPGRVRVILSRAIAALCALVCFVWVYYSFLLLLQHLDFGSFDELRADLNIPRWTTTVAFPIGFGLMGIEFVRFMFTAEPMHVGQPGVASDRAELEEAKADLAREDR